MKFARFSLLFLSCSLLLASCLKKDYDAPPDTSTYDPPGLTVNTSLKTLSNLGIGLGSGRYRKMGDTTIYGVVVADDKSGNYYKQIVIQDTSKGGIVLYLDKSYLYNEYPQGRGIYVNLKGLWLVNYKGLPEIVYDVDAAGNTTAIPSGMLGNYITKGKYPDNSVGAIETTLEEIKQNSNRYINTLVKIVGVQFNTGSAGQTYALPSAQASGTDRTIEICDHSANIIVRTSGYSSLQPYITPSGFGSLTCIVSNYAGSPQLIIRDTTDVRMTDPRCQ
jgi:hypothetical protein